MGKSLIVTEKPSVAMEFAKVLGVQQRKDGYLESCNYVITWCVGHLVGMVYPEEYDKKYAKWNLEDLPFLPDQYKYGVIASVKDQYKTVHRMLMRTDIDRVYWAGDAGKEGQTIEENIRNFGGVRKGMEELRVWIDSQTKEEILRGIREAKPMDDYRLLGESGIMRAIEDYAMGINFSRVMSLKYGNLLNNAAATKSYQAVAVGRVMTCVLGMVVQREREIRNFKETPFYRVTGSFTEAGIEGEWRAVEGSRFHQSPLLYKENGFKNEKSAKELISSLREKNAKILQLDKFVTKKRAPLLFNLAELQAECSRRFKISPDKTLQIAQDLYEKKLTTYPRTDARVLSSAVAREISKNVKGLGKYDRVSGFVREIMETEKYKGISGTQYVDDSKVSDHYAIIPTGHIGELESLDNLHMQVFELICRRFLSVFYPEAEYLNVKMTTAVDTEKFFSSAKVLKEAGFMKVTGLPESDRDDNGKFARLLKAADSLKTGEVIRVNDYSVGYGKTSPPKRYTSGSMVLAMENAGQLIEDEELREQIKGSGIGTSATRADIIKKLVRIGYLKLNTKTQVLTPENFGEMVYEVVNLSVPDLLNPKMSASWEKGLEGIVKGQVSFSVYKKTLDDYIRKETEKMIHQDFTEELTRRIRPYSTGSPNASSNSIGTSTGLKCPACGEDIVTTPFGFGCSGYKADKSGCGFCIGEIAGKKLSQTDVKKLISNGKTDLIKKFRSKKGTFFDAYLILDKDESNNPVIKFEYADIQTSDESRKCPKCGGPVLLFPKAAKCKNECGFIIFRTISGKELSEKHILSLIKTGHTGIISGFKSKNGKSFKAKLRLNKNYAIEFDFS